MLLLFILKIPFYKFLATALIAFFLGTTDSSPSLPAALPQPHPPSVTAPQAPSVSAEGGVILSELLAEVGIQERKLDVRVTENGLDYIATRLVPKIGEHMQEL